VSVLVGFIPTPEGRAALRAAATEARLRGTSLTVLNASTGDSFADPRWAPADVLAAVDEELDGAGVPHAVEQRSGRDPVDEIVVMADDEQVDLLVIGLRRRSAVGKLLMGSAAQRILLAARCPVLAVKVDG